MATLEAINFVPHRAEIRDESVIWAESGSRHHIKGLPQIVWGNHSPWREANLWALHLASTLNKNIKTVWSAMTHINAYAKWLEREEIAWWEFPAREADRCLPRFRGSLMHLINTGQIAPSTAQQRMAAVVRLYRWLAATGLLSPEWPMWREKQIGIHLVDSFGFNRTISMTTTDLAIRNNKIIGETLEDGMTPVARADIFQILDFASNNSSQEITLMLRLGFGTGMRFGTIADLKIKTVERAVPDPFFPGYMCLAVGPSAPPPVHTKRGVNGQIWISTSDLAALKLYIFSTRRLKRQAIAEAKNRDLIFLTRYGHSYGPQDGSTNRALNVELGRLRRAGLQAGITAFRNFRFHQTRCTFATELARVAILHGGINVAIALVKQALLHKNESTTLGYIKFVQKNEVMAASADEFTRLFLGLVNTQGMRDE